MKLTVVIQKIPKSLLIPLVLICLILGNLHLLHEKGISTLTTTDTAWDYAPVVPAEKEISRFLHKLESRADILDNGKDNVTIVSVGRGNETMIRDEKEKAISVIPGGKRKEITKPLGSEKAIISKVPGGKGKKIGRFLGLKKHAKDKNPKKHISVAYRSSSIRIPTISSAANTNHNMSSDSSHRIPRRLIFTYTRNLIQHNFPSHLHNNVLRTINFFTKAWGLPSPSQLDVLFLTDPDCIQLLEQVEPRMIPIFKAETLGSYKADMCRLAALYVHGGYYLDVDIEPVQVLEPKSDVDFITSKMTNGMFFQAIMAASANHPVLKSGLESMIIDWYMVPSILKEFNKANKFEPNFYRSKEYNEKRLEHVGGLGLNHDPKDTLMGPMTLRLAFDRNRNLTTPWFLLEEDNKKIRMYPELLRKATKDQSWGCNYMVHDPENQTAYFYSRCRGTWLCPFEKGA